MGNQNAVGNSGGGAPIRNTNAEKYGSWNDPLKEYDRLNDRSKEFVEELVRDTVMRSKADLPKEQIETKARRMGVLSVMHSRGWAYTLGDDGDGLAVERERDLEDGTAVIGMVLNPAIEADHRNNSKSYKLQRELRTYPTPGGHPRSDH